ncbi:tetrapyrrole biosynthesis uroporphyrinogen III synthase [Trametes meyenii]|nr:tetrapyrrole biosynthesis uroporphyrinogen III synthase [Trametes meyenii]
MPPTVLLLRSPAEDGGPDKYEDALRARGYAAVSVPVLETVHKNLNALADVVRGSAGSKQLSPRADTDARYAGVIVTSGRACEAWRAVVQELAEGPHNTQIGSDWSTVPFYAVGAATATALQAIQTAYPASPHVPRDIRGGAESGTAEKLAHFIVSDLAEAGLSSSRRLLYLTGDKNRDTLPKILGDGGLELESLQVYATQGSSRFEEELEAALGGGVPDENERWWVVHFAPSAAQAVSRVLSRHFDIPATGEEWVGEAPSIKRRAQVAAIGPTTSSFLRERLHVEVAVIAEKPTPDALSEGIASWDRTAG